MLDLLQNLWDRLASEGGVVSGAPLLFSAAVICSTAALSILIRIGLVRHYSGVIANRSATIQARDSQIGLLSAEIKTFEKRVDQLKAVTTPVPQEPDAIYQMGTQTGLGIGAQSDLVIGKYYFRAIQASGDFKRSANFKYRNLTMKIQSVGTESLTSVAGNIRRQLTDVECEVVDSN